MERCGHRSPSAPCPFCHFPTLQISTSLHRRSGLTRTSWAWSCTRSSSCSMPWYGRITVEVVHAVIQYWVYDIITIRPRKKMEIVAAEFGESRTPFSSCSILWYGSVTVDVFHDTELRKDGGRNWKKASYKQSQFAVVITEFLKEKFGCFSQMAPCSELTFSFSSPSRVPIETHSIRNF